MILKSSISFLAMSLLGFFLFAQGSMRISSGTQMVTSGKPYIVLNNMSWDNDGTFVPDSSTVRFAGTQSDSITGSSSTQFFAVSLDKANDSLILQQNIGVEDTFYFVAGQLFLNANDLDLGAKNGSLKGETETNRAVGSNGGEIIKVEVLNAPSGVNPGNLGATFTSSQNMDSTTIRRGHQVVALPGGGSSIERYYEVSPKNNGSLGATVQLAYLDAELNSLSEADLEPYEYANPNWINFEPTSANPGPNTVIFSRDSLLDLTLGEGALKLAAKVFLKGNYSTGTGMMTDNLRQNNLIPTTEPYLGLGYTMVGSGGETIDPSVLNVTGADAIVDWILVELRSKNDSSVIVRTQSALLQADGDIVDLDGKSDLNFGNLTPDEYFLMIKHRNHLGIRTPSAMSLARISTPQDFTSSLAMVWDKDGIINDAMDDLVSNGTVYGLHSGNPNGDFNLNVLDFFNTRTNITPIQSGVYSAGDINLDGNLNVFDFFLVRTQITPIKNAHLHN